MAHVLLAIKPRFADLIMSGKKVIEVRRGGTRIKTGDVLVLYSSSPKRSICATCVVGTVQTRSVCSVLDAVDLEAGVTKEELREYLSGAERASLIGIESVVCLSRPITLQELRRHSQMVIPQSYRFLNKEEVTTISRHLRS